MDTEALYVFQTAQLSVDFLLTDRLSPKLQRVTLKQQLPEQSTNLN